MYSILIDQKKKCSQNKKLITQGFSPYVIFLHQISFKLQAQIKQKKLMMILQNNRFLGILQ